MRMVSCVTDFVMGSHPLTRCRSKLIAKAERFGWEVVNAFRNSGIKWSRNTCVHVWGGGGGGGGAGAVEGIYISGPCTVKPCINHDDILPHATATRV